MHGGFRPPPECTTPAVFGRFHGCFPLISLISGRLHPQASSREVEVGKRHKAEHLGLVFGQPAIARFAIAELAFDDAKHMLHFGPHNAMFFLLCRFCEADKTRPGLRLSFTAQMAPRALVARLRLSLT